MAVMSLVLLLLATCGCGSGVKDIFILGGQSNMAGRGHVMSECNPNPSIFRLSAQLQWEQARDPLHADIDVGKHCGVGPGLAFANQLFRCTTATATIGLVPCAVGGTKITHWTRGSGLYNQLINRANESVKDGGTIRALVWYQGESDTVRKNDAHAYKGKLEKFIMDLRSDLHIPSLLVIQVAIASGEGKFVERVREAQLGIKLPDVKCVDAKGLQLKADKLHLTTMSQLHLGIMLAHAYLASSPHLQLSNRSYIC